ncbi:hypothetical protein GCM10011325_44350 [Dyadobacter sediminis]|nr:hypothetical protein GCM10011325_44350 [Dyadobacter sediminis]
MLDIRKIEGPQFKGVLFPEVDLTKTSPVDQLNSKPAHNLIIFNTGQTPVGSAGIGYDRGLYYNNGNEQNPSWIEVGKEIPHDGYYNQDYIFKITNTKNGNFNSSIWGVSETDGIGVRGESDKGSAVYGESKDGNGVYAVSETGNALNVKGKIRLQNNGEGAGKVLTSDASGNASWQASGSLPNVAFSVKGIVNNDSEIMSGTAKIVHFAAEKYDLNNNFNCACLQPQVQPISNFVVPYHGIYHFDASVIVNENVGEGVPHFVGQEMYLRVQRGNITFKEAGYYISIWEDGGSAEGSATLVLSKDVELWPGDLVSIFCSVKPTGSLPTSSLKTSEEDAYFNGRLVIKLN